MVATMLARFESHLADQFLKRNQMNYGEEVHKRYEVMLDEMVNCFLTMQLPKDFNPDCGISYTPPAADSPDHFYPVGTNLFTADQAREMFKRCVPPSCFGLDDCSSSSALSVCTHTDNCGK